LSYLFESVRVNQREVAISKIVSGEESGRTPFETSTFTFISDWLQGKDSFLQQTSGSTGAPKEIALTRKQMSGSAHRTLKALNIQEGDTALVCLHPQYIAGKMMLARALEFNLKIEGVEPSSDPLQSLPEDFQNGFAAFVPHQLATMIQKAERIGQLNRMKTILVGGAAVNETLLKEIKKLHVPVYATYGMTETISNIALQKLNGPDAQNNFYLVPGITVATNDHHCLVITLPELPDPVITHDIVQLNTDNSFRILGRLDNIINSGGIKISPEILEKEAEHILNRLGIFKSFLIGSIPHDTLGEQLVLIIQGSPLPARVERQLAEQFKSRLKPYEVPKQFRYLPDFTYTLSGKVDRTEILKRIR
jgi:O-succinylbenzoic acid--CoA ligase